MGNIEISTRYLGVLIVRLLQNLQKSKKILQENKEMAKISFKPLGGRVLIEPSEQDEVTAGGLFLPETAKEKPQQGKVLAAGPGDRNDKGERVAMDVKVGDIILFAKYSGTEVKIEGKKLLIMRESDLLGIVG
jgi:chaperonin GroES